MATEEKTTLPACPDCGETGTRHCGWCGGGHPGGHIETCPGPGLDGTYMKCHTPGCSNNHDEVNTKAATPTVPHAEKWVKICEREGLSLDSDPDTLKRHFRNNAKMIATLEALVDIRNRIDALEPFPGTYRDRAMYEMGFEDAKQAMRKALR